MWRVYAKSINKVSSIVKGKNAHSKELKPGHNIVKNIYNEIIKNPSLCGAVLKKNQSYKDVNLYLAHYTFQDFDSYITKKIVNFNDLFLYFFGKNRKILDKHKECKNDLVEYIYNIIVCPFNTKIISDLETKHGVLRKNKEIYKKLFEIFHSDDGKEYGSFNNSLVKFVYG